MLIKLFVIGHDWYRYGCIKKNIDFKLEFYLVNMVEGFEFIHRKDGRYNFTYPVRYWSKCLILHT